MATLVASAALLSACNGSSSSQKAELKTNMDSVAYATGVAYGAQTIQNLENLKAGLRAVATRRLSKSLSAVCRTVSRAPKTRSRLPTTWVLLWA